MKRMTQAALTAALVLSLSMFFSACSSGGGGDSASGPTSIATTTQGAKSAAASTNTAKTAAGTGAQLSSIGAVGTSNKVPTINVPFGANRNAKMLSRFSAKFSPAMRKAQSFKASMTGFPMTISCDSMVTGTVAPNSNNSITLDINSTGDTLSMTWTKCMENDTLTDGAMTMTGTDTSATFALGTSDSAPFTITTYVYSGGTVSTAVAQLDKTFMTMTWSSTGTTAGATDTMVANGWQEGWDYVGDTHEKLVMTSLTIKGETGTSTHAGSTYDVNTLTLDGAWTDTVYPDSKAGSAASFTDNSGFTAFVLKDEQPQYGSSATTAYLTMNGTFSSNTGDKCFDGTFTIVTVTPIQSSTVTGNTLAGEITINTNTDVVFNANGTVTITVDNGTPATFTDAQLDALCGY